LEINSDRIFDCALNLITLDQNELDASSADGSHRIYLGHNTTTDLTSDVESYDVILWGQDWVSAAMALTMDLEL
jgi:hypothetical protein